MDVNNKIINELPAIVWIGTKALEERLDSYYYNPTFIKQYTQMINGNVGVIGEHFNVTKLSGFEYTKYFTDEALKNGEIIAITSQNVGDCNLDIKEEKTMKIPSKLHNELTRSQLNYNDVVLSYTGHYRRAALILENINQKLHLGPNVCKLSPKNSNVDSAFLCVYLNSYTGQVYMDREKTISAQPTVNMDRIRNIQFPLPNIKIQNYIGNKIRKAEKLREEAKSFISDAEAILAKELEFEDGNMLFKGHAGKLKTDSEYKTNYNYVPTEYIFERLDAKAYHSELLDTLKKVDKFKTEKLMNLLLSYDTGMSQLNYSEEGVGVVSTGTINNDFLGEIEKYTLDSIPDDKFLSSEDVLLTMYGATSIGKVDVLNKDLKNATFDYTLLRMKFKEDYPPYFMSLILRTKLIQIQIKYSINSGGGTNFLNRQSVLELKIPIVPLEIRKKVNDLIKNANKNAIEANELILSAKNDIETLIKGDLDESVIKNVL